MKKFVIPAVVGVVLFLGTVLGLLAAQGRLNHAGTRGIPILESFFPAPPEPADKKGKDGKEGKEAADGHEAKDGHGEAAGGEHPPADAHAAPQQSDALGREKPLPYRVGTSVLKPEEAAKGGGHGGGHGGEAKKDGHGADAGHGDAKDAGHGDAGHADAAHADAGHGAAAQGDGHGPAKPDGESKGTPEWRAKTHALFGQGQYQPGKLWSFPQIESDLGADELNEILRRARLADGEIEREKARLARERTELEARERDVADRQEAVMKAMADVLNERAKLQAEINEFHNTVLLIGKDEVSSLQTVAQTLAKVEPKSAASVIKDWWKTEAGQTQALKIWTVMDPDAATAILAELDVDMIRQVLEKRLKVAREQGKPKK